jgi:hypothetical protein
MFPNFKTRQIGRLTLQRSSRREPRAATSPGPLANLAIMYGRFESHFNYYDESNVNRPLNFAEHDC